MNQTGSTLQALLDQFVEENSERGVQLAIYIEGDLAVNAFAGIAQPSTGLAVDARTLFPVFSTTKGMVATLIHLLVERGRLDYETRIAEVWPEFGAQGKGGITVRHVLNHTAGVPFAPAKVGHRELCDWETTCAAVADLKPASPPGMEVAYHALTYGWILGEVARRVDGRPFSQLLHEEICGPLNLQDTMFVGIPDEVESRVAILEARVEEGTNPAVPDDVPQGVPAPMQPLHEWMNRPEARRACFPASGGIMTAHAIARHYAALLPGGVDGIELLPPERIRAAIASQWPGNHQPGDPPTKHRLGYEVGTTFSATSFGHGGFGGSLGFADPDRQLAFGFTRNRFVSDASLTRIFEVLRKLPQLQ